jgi:parallel beta-helix repeat protein
MSSATIEVKNSSAFEVSENPTLYSGVRFDNCSDGLVTGNGRGEMFIANCTRFVVRENVNLTMELNDCNDTDVCENFIKNYGLVLRGCARCRVFSNTVDSIAFERGTIDSQINRNLIRNGTSQIWGGVYLDHVENITVDGNIIENQSWSPGIHLWYNVVNCTLIRNNISNCYSGITLRGGSGCVVYNNNILNSRWSGGYDISEHPVPDAYLDDYHGGGILDEQGWLNAWDGGYPGGGNYYFDYNGTDLYGGPAQDVIGADGIGDTPLVVYTYLPGDPGVDRYPLMAPYSG